MDDVRLIYSDSRDSWNVIVNAEWYYESKDYEKALDVFNSFFFDDPDEIESDEFDYDFLYG